MVIWLMNEPRIAIRYISCPTTVSLWTFLSFPSFLSRHLLPSLSLFSVSPQLSSPANDVEKIDDFPTAYFFHPFWQEVLGETEFGEKLEPVKCWWQRKRHRQRERICVWKEKKMNKKKKWSWSQSWVFVKNKLYQKYLIRFKLLLLSHNLHASKQECVTSRGTIQRDREKIQDLRHSQKIRTFSCCYEKYLMTCGNLSFHEGDEEEFLAENQIWKGNRTGLTRMWLLMKSERRRTTGNEKMWIRGEKRKKKEKEEKDFKLTWQMGISKKGGISSFWRSEWERETRQELCPSSPSPDTRPSVRMIYTRHSMARFFFTLAHHWTDLFTTTSLGAGKEMEKDLLKVFRLFADLSLKVKDDHKGIKE